MVSFVHEWMMPKNDTLIFFWYTVNKDKLVSEHDLQKNVQHLNPIKSATTKTLLMAFCNSNPNNNQTYNMKKNNLPVFFFPQKILLDWIVWSSIKPRQADFHELLAVIFLVRAQELGGERRGTIEQSDQQPIREAQWVLKRICWKYKTILQ